MDHPISEWHHDVVSALAYSLAEALSNDPRLAAPYNDLTRFLLEQHGRLPDYLREPLRDAALSFDCLPLLAGKPRFHKNPATARAQRLAAWRNARFGPKRDLIRYWESLAAYKLFTRLSEVEPATAPRSTASTLESSQDLHPPTSMACEIAVVGSGPGGSITACLLAEAGRDVLLLEEGPYQAPGSVPPFSSEEMARLYRRGGQTVALGRNKVAYVEGCCVGGGSEINSGLYHRLPDEILARWHEEFGLACTSGELRPHFEAIERELSVSFLPGPAPIASVKLHQGAANLDWKSLEVPRWFKHDPGQPPQRQTMARTYIPRFLNAGGKLMPQTRVERIRSAGAFWYLEARTSVGQSVEIRCEHLFLAAGAVQTPALLRRSGLKRNIGSSLRLHPTIKVVAEFDHPVNAANMGVPVHQVKQFAPSLSFGCSISSPPFLALGLLRSLPGLQLAERWPFMASYYAMSADDSVGTVRIMPGFRDPVVRYRLHPTEKITLARGLRLLGRALLAAGATRIYAGTSAGGVFASEADLAAFPDIPEDNSLNLMTIHLFSSCPMGEDRDRSAVNSFGRVHGHPNLFVADASLLCTAPSVNPQGTVMAFARRNALHFLGRL